MSSKASPTVIGGFVVGAVVLATASVVYFGSGTYLAYKEKYVLEFTGSLAGLSVGAPVNYRGVKVGMVSDIVVRYDQRDQRFRIPVYIEIDTNRIDSTANLDDPQDRQRVINIMVERGLKAKLSLQSFLTGQMAIQLYLDPSEEAVFTGVDHSYVELPTVASSLEKIEESIDELPIDELISKLTSAIGGISDIVNSEDTRAAIKSIRESFDSVNRLVVHVDKRVDPLADSIEQTVVAAQAALERATEAIDALEGPVTQALADIRGLTHDIDKEIEPAVASFREAAHAAKDSLEQARQTLATLDGVLSADSAIHRQLLASLQQLADAARSIRNLADFLERHPESLIQGKSGS